MTMTKETGRLGITERQAAFINVLREERDTTGILHPPVVSLSRKGASDLIDSLLRAPKKLSADADSASCAAITPLTAALAETPKSKYAIPAEEIDLSLSVNTPINGDMLFLEVREYRDRRYMRRLTGSVGGFTRWKITTPDQLVILNIINSDPYKYTKLFGEHYACCGSCGAELTDQRSRELQLGPECRKKFGFTK